MITAHGQRRYDLRRRIHIVMRREMSARWESLINEAEKKPPATGGHSERKDAMNNSIPQPVTQDKYDRLAELYRRLVSRGMSEDCAARCVDAVMVADMRRRGVRVTEADL